MKNLFVALGIALLASAAHAQSPRTAADARRVFDEMRAKYAAVETYSCKVTINNAQGKPGPAQIEIAFREPNRFAKKIKTPQGAHLSVSNGRTSYFYDSHQSKAKYFASPMPPQELGRIGLMQNMPFGSVFSPLLAGIDPYAAPWGEVPHAFSWGKSTKVNGISVDAIRVQLAGNNNETITYFIGQKDRLLYRFTGTGGSGKSAYTHTETFSDIYINPKIPIDTFAFVPPPNTRRDDWIKTYFGGTIPDNLKIGAVPPALEGTDLQGRTIRLEDYKGKVVLLDFWATWCVPCVVEMPFIKAAYEKFYDQGFEVIGISFDKDRKALEKYLGGKNLPWKQLFADKMFEDEIYKNYKIRGFPTYYLIGRDGKIAEFNPSRLLLEPAIEKALSAPTPE